MRTTVEIPERTFRRAKGVTMRQVVTDALEAWLSKAAGPGAASEPPWIAALARQCDMPVLCNDRHFDEVGDVKGIGF